VSSPACDQIPPGSSPPSTRQVFCLGPPWPSNCSRGIAQTSEFFSRGQRSLNAGPNGRNQEFGLEPYKPGPPLTFTFLTQLEIVKSLAQRVPVCRLLVPVPRWKILPQFRCSEASGLFESLNQLFVSLTPSFSCYSLVTSLSNRFSSHESY
jgi:hypothetical protein